MTIEFVYSDGRVESVKDFAPLIRARFAEFVTYAVSHYVDGFVECRILDNTGRLFRLFRQY